MALFASSRTILSISASQDTIHLFDSDFCVVDYRFLTNSLSRDKEGMLKGIMRALDRLEAETTLTPCERRRLRTTGAAAGGMSLTQTIRWLIISKASITGFGRC